MNSRSRFLTFVAVIALALAVAGPSFGQVLKGSISGTVTDPQGAIVSGAVVAARNVETGALYKTTTDNSGLFRMSLLPTGHYNVTVGTQGTKTLIIKDAVIAAGEDRGMGTIRLTAGSTTETVETSASNMVTKTQSQITNLFSGITLQTFSGIQEGQGLDKLALFVPGVANTRTDNFSNSNGAPFSVNGQRGRNNDQLIDGQRNNDPDIGGPGLFVTDTEFVQQYVLVTNQFGPEYGRNAGSVVNIITKQGTNKWHGSGYGTWNNSTFNALTNTQKVFLNLDTPPDSNNEFSGFTLGGPIVKNKLFNFIGFNNDILSQDSTYTSNSLTPTPAGLASLAACPGINANALHILTTFGPYGFTAGNPTPLVNPTTGLFNNLTINGCPVQFGGVSRTLPNSSHAYNFIDKMDWQRGSDTITGRYIFNRSTTFNSSDNGAGGWVFDIPSLSQAALVSWTHNFSAHMVNEARVSYGRQNVQFGGNSIGNQFEPEAPLFGTALTNITIGGGILGIGPATNLPQSRIVNTWQAQDNWNYVLGRHSLKAGANYTFQQSPNIFLPNVNGQFQFSNFTSFIVNNTPSTIRITQGLSEFDFKEHNVFLYAGDDWKIRQNLTLNLGITWSYYGAPANLFNQLTETRESNPTTAFWNPALPLSVRTVPIVPSKLNNVGPSIGFAYSPQWGGFLTGHGKTVFRGGYRLLYDPPFYNIFLDVSDSAPNAFLTTLTGAQATANHLPATPTGSNIRTQLAPFITPGVLDPRTLPITTLSPDFGPQKVNEWSLGFEREISKNSALEMRYVGNHAIHLYQALNGNPFIGDLKTDFPTLVPSNFTPCPAINAFNPIAIGRVNCTEGVQRQFTSTGFSNYNGLQVEFRANNLFKQLSVRTGYTFSKTLDNVSEIFSTQSAGNTNAFSQNMVVPGSAEYSESGLNFPHIWNLNFTEQLPFFKEQKGFSGKLLGGWTLAGNYILASGQPFTPSQFSAARTTAAGNYYDSSFVGSFSGFDIARPFLGSLDAPDNQVGIFATDLCRAFFGVTPANNPAFPGACNTAITPAGQLLSMNSLNVGGFLHGPGTAALQTPVNATSNSVRFILNGGFSQSIFGTPFGNAPRNALSDARTNIFNLSIYKEFRLCERAHLEVHATALNLFNHYNFAGIDPFIEDAGLSGSFGQGFNNPRVESATGRTVFIGAKIRF